MPITERLGQVQVSIEGNPEQEVLRFQVETITGIDDKGAPQGAPVVRRLCLTTRVHEGLFDAAQWAVNEPRAKHNLKNGIIKFYNKDGENYQTLEWTNGFIEKAEWVLPDAERSEEQRVYMQYQIVVNKMSIGGAELVNPWTRTA